MPTISESQPTLYKSLFPDLFALEIPDETKATCTNCAMCASSCGDNGIRQDAGAEPTYFEPNIKCCSFHPTIPNYLVGAILADMSEGSDIGKNKIAEKLAQRIGVTPYGVAAPAKYTLLYGQSSEFFGRSVAMRCPYFIDEGGGLCSIWKFRDAVCSTYFCKHVSGVDGRRFWMSLKSYLALAEQQLSRFATYTLYPDYVLDRRHPADPPARRLELEELEDRSPSQKQYSALWGSWEGLEREFFEECYKLIKSLSPERVQEILGLDGEISQSVLRKHFREMTSPQLPKTLRLNPNVSVKHLGNGEIVLAAYSEIDSVAVPEQAYPLLQEFRGNLSVSDVRARLRSEKQSDFSDEVLLSLYQHRVLEEMR